jgi:hypothetical protein
MSGRRTVSGYSSVTADTGKLTTEGSAGSLEGAARSRPETTVSSGNGHVYLDGARRERQAALGAHL